jgi:hypothetical protein
MTDDHHAAEPGDLRDERVAERLRVEPLDEVTRARLVRTAMAGAPAASTWSARTRGLGIAAALVVVLAVGFAVLARNGSDSGTTSTAARAPKAADSLERSRTATADELGEGLQFSIVAGVAPLGDLGDVGSNGALRRAVLATDAFAKLGEPGETAAAVPSAASAAPQSDAALRVITTACDTGAIDRLGKLVAVGTGTADGAPVTVYVVERPNGAHVGVVIGPDCAVGKPVPL